MITTSHYRRSHCAVFLVNLKEEGRLDLVKELYEEYSNENEHQYTNKVIFVANLFDKSNTSLDSDPNDKTWKKAKEFCASNNIEIYEGNLGKEAGKITDLVWKFLESFVRSNYPALVEEKRFIHQTKEKSSCALI